MNTNLKPCARCGSTRVEMIAVRPWLSLREQQAWEPFCHDCDVAGYLRSEQARIDAWNRRPIEDALRAKLAITVEALKVIQNGEMMAIDGVSYTPGLIAKLALDRIGGKNE